jgi:hypothetical protein
MNIEDHLHTLRTQPHHIRQRIAFIGAASITFFVFLFWLSYASKNIPLVATLFGNEQKGAAMVSGEGAPTKSSQHLTASAAEAAPFEIFSGAIHTLADAKNTAFSIGAAVGALFTGPTYNASASTTPVEVEVIVPGRRSSSSASSAY